MSLNATGTLVKLFRERSKPTASRGVALSTRVRPDRKGDGGVACCRPDDGGDLKSAGGAVGKNPTLVRLRKSNGDGERSTNCDGNVVGGAAERDGEAGACCGGRVASVEGH